MFDICTWFLHRHIKVIYKTKSLYSVPYVCFSPLVCPSHWIVSHVPFQLLPLPNSSLNNYNMTQTHVLKSFPFDLWNMPQIWTHFSILTVTVLVNPFFIVCLKYVRNSLSCSILFLLLHLSPFQTTLHLVSRIYFNINVWSCDSLTQ